MTAFAPALARALRAEMSSSITGETLLAGADEEEEEEDDDDDDNDVFITPLRRPTSARRLSSIRANRSR